MDNSKVFRNCNFFLFRTRSFRDPGAKAGKSAARKYRGSKTDSALSDPAVDPAKRSSRDVTKSKSRKSSLIGSFSNMFKAGLKL